MVIKIRIEQGNKSSNDKIVRIWANGDIITLELFFKILDIILKSEDSNYPISQGYEGRAYILKAIIDLALGIPLEKVLEKYRIKRKTKCLRVKIRPIDKLYEILE